MALKIYNYTFVTSGTAVDLGTSDDLYVGKNGLIGSEESFGVYATGSDHDIAVLGEVVGSSYGILIDQYLPISGERVTVGETGSVTGSYGIYIDASGSSVENEGVIRGDIWSVSINGNANSGQSSLFNSGLIVGGILRDGSEGFELVNEGVIRKDLGNDFAYIGTGTGDESLENSGVINGNIVFGEGNDVYDGRDGILKNAYVVGGLGNDTLLGGARDEEFIGGIGADILKGGAGADRFGFDDGDSTAAKAGRDVIKDFSQAQHDLIDLAFVDSIPSNGIDNDDEFNFIGKQAFSGQAGELRFSAFGANTLVSADLDGDKLADFAIELQGRHNLVADDFVL
jgi:Ca2+-binding RTX toxin-like protein